MIPAAIDPESATEAVRQPRRSVLRRASLLLIAGWALTLAVLFLWLRRTPNAVLRDELRRWQFWSLEVQFLLVVGLSWINAIPFLRSLHVRRADLIVPTAAAALAFALTVGVAPRTNRIYYDEQIYQGIGQNMSDLRLAQMCNDGNVEYGALQCWSGEYNKEPYGYPYILSLAYRLAGVHEATAFWINAIAAASIVLVVFLITTALTGHARAGHYASFVMALIPEHLVWSHTAAAEPTAALACGFAVMTALAFARLRSTPSLLWMVAATVFAVQFRTECILVVGVVGLIVLLYAREELSGARFWGAALIGLLLAGVHVGHLIAVRDEQWGATGPRISTAFLAGNLHVNGWFYLADARFPFVYTGLAALSIVAWRRFRPIAIPAVYFLAFWGIFLLFYAGSYDYGADDRFSLMTYAPIAVLAGVGAWMADGWLGRRRLPAASIIVSVLCLQFLWYLPFVRKTGEEAWGARADVAFARKFAADLPQNSIILTHNPNMFHVWGLSAAQASIAAGDIGYVRNGLAKRYAGGVYFHWNFWCNVADPVQQRFCTTVIDRYPHTLLREYRERDYRYALYRLDVDPDPPAEQTARH